MNNVSMNASPRDRTDLASQKKQALDCRGWFGARGMLAVGSLGILTPILTAGAPLRGDDKSITGNVRSGSVTTNLIDERSEIDRIDKAIKDLIVPRVAQVNANISSFQDLNSTLLALSESKVTKSLRGEGSDAPVMDPVALSRLAAEYLACQGRSPQFTGNISTLAQLSKLCDSSSELVADVTQPRFMGRALSAFNDYRMGVIADCDKAVSERFFGAKLFGNSLRSGLLRRMREEPTAAIAEKSEVFANAYQTVADLEKQEKPTEPIKLVVSLPIKDLPEEVLVSLALRTGALSTSVHVAGNYFNKDASDAGYHIVQNVYWQRVLQTADPKSVPIVVYSRVLTNMAGEKWAAERQRIEKLQSELTVKTTTQSGEGEGIVIKRGAGHVVIQSWATETNDVKKNLEAFAAQWASGMYPGFKPVVAERNAPKFVSEKPAPLSDIFDKWAVRMPTNSTTLDQIRDINEVALAAANTELAQKMRNQLIADSVALKEAHVLVEAIRYSIKQLCNDRVAQTLPSQTFLNPADIRTALSSASSPGAVIATLDDRFRLVSLAILRLQGLLKEGNGVNVSIAGPLAESAGSLDRFLDRQSHGFKALAPLTERGLSLGENESKWIPDSNWFQLVKLVQGANIPDSPPLFATFDPRGSKLEELDLELGVVPGTARALAVIEVAKVLGSSHPQSLLEFNYLNVKAPPSSARVVVLNDKGESLGIFALSSSVIEKKFGIGAKVLLAKGLADIVLVDIGRRVPIEQLKQDKVFADVLRRDLIGDTLWQARNFVGNPTSSASYQRETMKIETEAAGKNSESVKFPLSVSFDAYIKFSEHCELAGAMVPLGYLEAGFYPTNKAKVAELLSERAIQLGSKDKLPSLLQPDDDVILRSRAIEGEELGIPLAYISEPQGNAVIDIAAIKISTNDVKAILTEELEAYTRRMFNALDPTANTLVHPVEVQKTKHEIN